MKRVKKLLAGLLVGVMMVSSVLTASAASKFEDVKEGAWYEKFVNAVAEEGIMNGVSETKFGVGMEMTREMFVQVLYNKEGAPEDVTWDDRFSDVEDGKWYAKAVIWANDNNIVAGIGGGKFGVEGKITREQLATMLYNYATNFKGIDTTVEEGSVDTDSIVDMDDISEYAVTPMMWAVANGVMAGSTSGDGVALNPGANATREQCATMVINYLIAYEGFTFEEEEEDEVVHNFKYIVDETTGEYAKENYSFYLNEYIADVAEGDEVKITAEFNSDTYFGGSIQANKVDAENEKGYSWGEVTPVANVDGTTACTVSGTLEVPFGAGYNEVQVQMWWMGETENGVDLVSLTVERVESEEPDEPVNPYGVIWEGEEDVDWNNEVWISLAKDKFENLKFDGTEKMLITYKSTDTSAWGSQFKYVSGDWGTTYLDAYNLSISADATVEAITLTEDYASMATLGLIVQGWNVTVTSIELVGEVEELWTGEKAITWGDAVILDKSLFTDLAFDGTEKIFITYASTDATAWGTQFKFVCGPEWEIVLKDAYNLQIAKTSLCEDIVLTADYAAIAENGIVISGFNATVTKVEIVK